MRPLHHRSRSALISVAPGCHCSAECQAAGDAGVVGRRQEAEDDPI